MKRKWKNDRGETLVEVLVSILVGALSIALLFTAVMASTDMDKKAKKTDAEYITDLNAAEAQGIENVTDPFEEGTAPEDKKVAVTNGDSTAKVTVTFYGGEGAISYKLP